MQSADDGLDFSTGVKRGWAMLIANKAIYYLDVVKMAATERPDDRVDLLVNAAETKNPRVARGDARVSESGIKT